MIDQNCGYCVGGEALAKFGIPICELKVSSLILFKEQSKPGRCIVAFNRHVGEMVDLSEEERRDFFEDVNKAAKAIHKVFQPDKLNYGAYGDTGSHLHFHLVPKYAGEDEWGGTFLMNPDKKYLTDEEYQEMIQKIKAEVEHDDN
ncbi:MAG TPA: HIT family protein [Candidatus Dorea intestinavium]|nr:HIT family protein [Candidatus Dorea intestinavium]